VFAGSASKLTGYAAKAVVYFAAALIPLFLWTVYFQLSWWGIGCAPHVEEKHCAPHTPTITYPHTPRWLSQFADWLFGSQPYPMVTLYLVCAAVLLIASMFLSPNANSLHRLYRDRLSKAFLFKPQSEATRHDLPAIDGFKLTDLDSQVVNSLPDFWIDYRKSMALQSLQLPLWFENSLCGPLSNKVEID
jgi:hypothetical protein